jgi:hypothetical protein
VALVLVLVLMLVLLVVLVVLVVLVLILLAGQVAPIERAAPKHTLTCCTMHLCESPFSP